MDTKKLLLGSHVSMSSPDYLVGAVNESINNGANAMMIYTGAPQNTKRVPLENLKIQQGLDIWKQAGNSEENIVVHAPYIINLANTVKPETFDLAKRVLADEIDRTKAIGAKYLVVHPGSYLTATLQQGIDQIVSGIDEVLENHQGVIIALETMAGKGKEVGFEFEQIAQIINSSKYPQFLGVTFDSCHVWDSGYDLNDIDHILEKFDEIIGLDKLKVLHINDSKNELGAKKDRHANIGQGYIGKENLIKLVHHPLLAGKPMILETPYIDGKSPYKDEIEMLRKGE